jgi:stress response protein SCP2
MVKHVSPLSTESRDILDKPLAFMHTGDDDTGTGDTFDEEILVNLPVVDNEITDIFFVILSVNHGFNEIKGGFWSIVRTVDETDLITARLQTTLQDRVHIMARLTRKDSCWELDELGAYGSLNNNEDDLLSERIDQLLTAQYFSKVAAGA